MRGMSDEIRYDKRLIERYIRQGLITRDEVNKRMTQNGDLEPQAESIDVDAMMREMQNAGRRRVRREKAPGRAQAGV